MGRKETPHQGFTAEKCTAQLAGLKPRKICELQMLNLLPLLLLGRICSSSAKVTLLISTGYHLSSEGAVSIMFCSKTVQYEHGLATRLPEQYCHFLTAEGCRKVSANFKHKGDASAVTMGFRSGRTVTS
jgi:hypothetical protein